MDDVKLYQSITAKIKRLQKIQKKLREKHMVWAGCKYEVEELIETEKGIFSGDKCCPCYCIHDCDEGAIMRFDEAFLGAGIY